MATPKIDKWYEEVRGLSLFPEAKARHIGETPELLEELLRDMVTMLVKKYRDIFRGAQFDFESKRLIARDGSHVLLWTLREFASKPISVNNQQTSLGYIGVYRVLENYGRSR